MKTIQVAERYIKECIVSQLIGRDGQPTDCSLEVGDEWVGERKIDYVVYEYTNDSGVPTGVEYYDTIAKIKETYPENEWVWE